MSAYKTLACCCCSYRKTAKQYSKMISAKVLTPEERLIRYTEFAAEFDVHGALDISGRYLSTIEYYCLDVGGGGGGNLALISGGFRFMRLFSPASYLRSQSPSTRSRLRFVLLGGSLAVAATSRKLSSANSSVRCLQNQFLASFPFVAFNISNCIVAADV